MNVYTDWMGITKAVFVVPLKFLDDEQSSMFSVLWNNLSLYRPLNY